MCSQPIVQATQLARVFARPALSSCGDRFGDSANVPLWKLRVGSVPKRLNVRILVAVPSSRYLAVAGPIDRFDRSRLSSVTRLGSAYSEYVAPRTAIALMFLLPRTAPLPPRPAWRPS